MGIVDHETRIYDSAGEPPRWESPSVHMAEPLEGFSTLVQKDHPDVLSVFSSEDYRQSAEQVCAAGRVGVSAENLLALLAGRRENVKKALRVGVSPGVRKALWISLASFTKAGSVYRGALGDVSQGTPLQYTRMQPCPCVCPSGVQMAESPSPWRPTVGCMAQTATACLNVKGAVRPGGVSWRRCAPPTAASHTVHSSLLSWLWPATSLRSLSASASWTRC